MSSNVSSGGISKDISKVSFVPEGNIVGIQFYVLGDEEILEKS